ncbi:hypothetical protein NIES4073_35810 [Kalymmatonema gypsitolerans NIES-4073]|nr:hypothetical protein NIES4073_35810 [Scytonema sp. NIES-4073]
MTNDKDVETRRHSRHEGDQRPTGEPVPWAWETRLCPESLRTRCAHEGACALRLRTRCLLRRG